MTDTHAPAEPSDDLHIEHRLEDGTAHLTISGEIDISTLPSLRAAVVTALDGQPARVEFDLAGVEFIDSSGLAVLLEVASTTETRVVHPSPAARRVIELAGLSTVLPMAP